MSAFTVLSGKTLARAIKGFGASVATFSAKTHQLAYSALAHVEEHSCASHLNALFAATPLNYRGALRIWACDLGKVTFDAKPEDGATFFTYAKGKKSDMDAALATGPVEYQRGEKSADAKAFDEIAAFEALAKKLADKGASARAVELANAAIRALKMPVVAAAPKKPDAPKVVVSNTVPQLELAAA